MVSLQSLVKAIASRAQSDDPNYLETVETQLLLIWQRISEERPWRFLLAVDPYEFTLEPDTPTYRIPFTDAPIQFCYDLLDSDGYSYAGFLDQPAFQNMKNTGQLPAEWTRQGVTQPGTWFTLRGRAGQETIIEVWPLPTQSKAVKLAYTEIGTKANFDKAPASAVLALTHGTLALIAPPVKVEPDLWKAITYREDDLFDKAVKAMGKIQPMAAAYRPPVTLDQHIADQLNEMDV